MEFPAFNPGTGTCDPDPQRCLFEDTFEESSQRIRVYWKLNLDGLP
jgi:hypothetical protein